MLVISLMLFPAERRFFSYVDISFMQSAEISDEFFFSGGDVKGLISLLYDFDEKRSAYLSYSIGYDGPGNYIADKDIKERSILNSLFAEYHYMWKSNLRIRPSIYFNVEKFKDNALSNYNDNIYNNAVSGIGMSLDLIKKEYYLTFISGYRKIHYPNYTDLISEIKYDSNFTKTGMYDKDVYEIGFRLKKEIWFSDLSYKRYVYARQRTIKPDGTVSGPRQRDSDFIIVVGQNRRVGFFNFYPSLSLSIYSSNQNYLRYRDLFDTSPFFVEDAYSRKDFEIGIPLSVDLEHASLNLTAVLSSRFYSSRPPRDKNNNYLVGKKQHQYIYRFCADYTIRITDLTYWKIGYALHISKSNNRFETYIPYNYTAHSFYLGYGIRY
ncbi:MAG: hypothetical protein ACP5PA_00545 [Elusimicrobiales bacterium]